MFAGKSTAMYKYNSIYKFPMVQPKSREQFEWTNKTHGGKQFINYFYYSSLLPNISKTNENLINKFKESKNSKSTSPIFLPQSEQWPLYVKIVLSGGLCIDEFQFMDLNSDELKILDFMAAHGIDIQIAILSGTFERKPWNAFGSILSLADNIYHLTSKCYFCGREAPFSMKISGGNKIIDLDKNLYVPLCRTCFLSAQK